jgi:hypothetical protein
MTTSTSAGHVVSEQPDLTGVSLDALPSVDTSGAAAVVNRAVGSPERDRQEQDVRDVVSEQPDLTGVSLEALPSVDTAGAAAVVDRAVGSPERDRQSQNEA